MKKPDTHLIIGLLTLLVVNAFDQPNGAIFAGIFFASAALGYGISLWRFFKKFLRDLDGELRRRW